MKDFLEHSGYKIIIIFSVFLLSSLNLQSKSIQNGWRHINNHAFEVGEELEYEMGWKAATAGTALFKVEAIVPRKDRRTYKITMEATSNQLIDAIFMVRDRYESWMDVEALASDGFMKNVDEGGYKKNLTIFINPPTGQFQSIETRLDKKSEPKIEKGKFSPNIQDVLSTAYFVRTLSLKVGQTIDLTVANGLEEKKIRLKILREEQVASGTSQFACYVIEPLFEENGIYSSLKDAKLRIWLNKEPNHIPVKVSAEFSFGEVTADLIRYKPGR